MVHKRYVKRGNKVYGPYLYNSKRVGNKVVNEYLGIDKSGEWKKAGLMVSFFVILLLGIVYAEYGIMSGSASGTTSSLSVWDQGSGGIDNSTWLSNCTDTWDPPTSLCLPTKATSQWKVLFYANYSNSTVGPIMGNCSIRFNYTGTYGTFSEMNYNPITLLYEFNSSFNIRSNYSTQFIVQINCSNISSDSNTRYDNLSAVDYFEIKNSDPYKTYIAGMGPAAQTCNEDTTCTYNVSANFTDDDDNDLPLSSFNINSTSSTFSTCILSVSDLGIITVLCTNSSQAGSYNAFVTARDGAGSSSASLTIPYTINAVNDKPIITASTLSQTCTQGTLCAFNISVWDEESGAITGGIGAIGNFTFTKNNTLSSVSINSTIGEISFTPTNAQVGTQKIEINITDPSGDTNSSVLTLTINDLNDAPNLYYACENINNTLLTEDAPFSCMLNASDIDSPETHIYSSNYSSWFTISCGTQAVSGGNTSCNVTFTPTDIAVYSHKINVTVTDSGSLTSSRLLNFSVNNVPDYPYWTNITNMTFWTNLSFWYRINANDNDTLTQFGDWINYTDNTTLFEINGTTGIVSFFANTTGIYWINITANDSTGLAVSYIMNFTIYANSYPRLVINQEHNLTEGYLFYLNISANATTDAGESITYADNTSLFDINLTTGEINFTPIDNNVGTHWVEINLTDNHGTRISYLFNFTVYNEEDAPVLNPIYNITDALEGAAYTFMLNFTDADLNITGGTELINVRSNSTALFALSINVNASNATNGVVNLPISFTPASGTNGTHWLNITLNDSAGLGASQIFFINVSESNIAPFFINGSASFCTTRAATEDSGFTSCTIIACDNDTGTTLRFATNYTWFSFNTSNLTAALDPAWGYCTNTTVNFTPLQAQVGNWSIALNVTDNGGLSAEYTLYFNVSNTNDVPILTAIPMLNASIDALFSYDINTTLQKLIGNIRYDTDEDNDTLAFSVNTTTLYSTVTITLNSSTGIISFTPISSPGANKMYSINITVNDTSGVQDSQVVNINVSANQAPTCSVISNTYLTPNIIFDPRTETSVVNLSESLFTGGFSASCTDPEGETPTSLTYTWYWNASINQTNTSNTFGYHIGYRDAGYYNITLNVTDSQSQQSTYAITVNITNVNAPPMLTSNIPNISSLPNNNGWYNDVQNSRNISSYFNDQDGNNLAYSWYWYALNESFNDNNASRAMAGWTVVGNWNLTNDTLNNPAIRQNYTTGIVYANISSLTYINLTGFSARIKLMGPGSAGLCFASSGGCSQNAQMVFFNSTDNRTYLVKYESSILSYTNSSSPFNVTLNTSYWIRAKVKGNNTLAYTSVNGTDWNLVYNASFGETASGKLQLITISGDAIFDDIKIKDPNLRNMTLANLGGGNISFTPAASWHGEVQMVISATDGINETDSNVFTLHVDEVTVPPPETVTQTSISSTTITQTKVADMTILVPSMISLTPLSKTIVPVILKNTGQIELSTITLTATSNQTELRLKLNETAWPMIKIGDSVYVNLEVDIGLLAPDRYTIRLDAESQIPALKRFAEIVVDVREKDAVLKAQLKEMIQFTRDLFLQNPECLELTELINEAEEKFRTYQYQEGLEMIHRANQGCKEFIAAKEGESQTNLMGTAKTFIQKHWKTIILEGIGLIIAILLLIYYFQRRSAAKL